MENKEILFRFLSSFLVSAFVALFIILAVIGFVYLLRKVFIFLYRQCVYYLRRRYCIIYIPRLESDEIYDELIKIFKNSGASFIEYELKEQEKIIEWIKESKNFSIPVLINWRENIIPNGAIIIRDGEDFFKNLREKHLFFKKDAKDLERLEKSYRFKKQKKIYPYQYYY